MLASPLLVVLPSEAAAQTGPTISISAPADAAEDDSGTRNLFFTVTLSEAVHDGATNYQVCFEGTATIHTPDSAVFSAPYPDIPADSDYQLVRDQGGGNFFVWNANCLNGSFGIGETTESAIGIRVKGDTDAEADETVTATLTLRDPNLGGVTLGTATATHTILDDDTPTQVSVAPDWPLTPSGLSGGDSFRLLFVSSTTRNASDTDIATYNSFVQTAAKAGHMAISDDVGDAFTAVASTSSVDARDNTSTTGAGVPIYWLGGDKAADDYADFYDGSWDSHAARNESGTIIGGTVRVFTGSNDDGTKHATDYLGNNNVQAGSVGTGSDPFTAVTLAGSNSRSFYGLSPVFTVVAPPEISVELPTGEGESRTDAGEKKADESEGGVGIGFPLKADQTLATALTVCVRVTETVGARVASGDEGLKEVSLTSSGMNVGDGTHTLTWTNTAADDRDSSVTVEIVPPDTASCSADDGSYTVSSSDGSDKVLIQDDEETTVSLTSSDMTMTEGDATDTATLTVSLSRRLYAGEVIAAPIALTTSTGARLPGSGTANHDFTVAASGTGATLANASASTPRVILTGSDSGSAVQTATVTLTPVANRDDPDSTDETITATLTSLGVTGLETTVSGGVTADGANNAATLTLADDEAAPVACSAQSNVFSGTSLRIVETGETTYCVRLATAPSGGVTTVAIGRAGGNQNAANFSPSSLTFTASNYQTPQQVTVTGADEPGTHRNRPDMQLTHTANGGGYSNQSLGNVRVEVDDAPEVEVFSVVRYDNENRWRWFVNGNGGKLRPSTITAAPGITPMRNVTPCCEVQYAIRLSNKPLGGPVTVDISVGDFGGTTASSITGISLTRSGTPVQSLQVTFEERSPSPGCGWLVQPDGTYRDSSSRLRNGISDSYDNNADTSWECYRFIWVHNKREHQNPNRSLCADITHTAAGGGVRKVTVDTIRMHSLGFDSGRVHDNPACPFLYANTLPAPQNTRLPVEAAPVPTTAVAGLAVADGGGTTATASWDAVPHATKYSVAYSAQANDGSLTQTAGAFDDITATSHPFDHGIAAPATVTVTVTPGYDNDDSDGGAPAVTYLDSLAATATLNTGTTADAGETAQEEEADGDGPEAPPPGCVPDKTLELARGYYDLNKHRTPGYGRNWRRVLIAFGDVSDSKLTAFTAAEARQSETRWAGWGPFREALECIEKAQQDPAPPPVEPEIAVTAGADVTEGGDVTFTVTAAPAPAADLNITVEITQTGAFVSTGTQTVTIGTSGTETFTVATADDSADEADGSVTAAIGTGTGYTVSTSSGAATVAVADNDIPEITITAGTDVTEGGDAVFTIAADPLPHTALDVAVEITQTGDHGAAAGTRTVTIPATGTYTLTVATTNDSDDEADGSITATVSTGAGYTVSSANSTATVAVADDDDPPPPPPPPVECVSDETLRLARDYYELNRHRAPGYGSNWRRVLVAFGDIADDQLTAFTAAEALAREQIWYGWKPFREALECIEAAQ